MLISIAFMLMLGMFLGWVCRKLRLPGLMGMIFTGVLLGPYALNLIDVSILNISSELRRIALIIILMRAGLSLDLNDLKKVGRPAVLMCFLPACFEILGMVGAVSPAVIVPKMLKLIEDGYGTDKGIPQLLLAGASVDDVFVIVMFTAFTGLAQGGSISPISFVKIPVSILIGSFIGLAAGWGLAVYFKRVHIRDTVKVIVLLCVSFILVTLEDRYSDIVPFSSLISVMGIGIALQKKREEAARRLSVKFNKVWVCAEIMLFVLVGATVNIHYALSAGVWAVILIFGVLVFRMAGVFCCLAGTRLNMKERVFCMIGYMPKATVQAAIGGVPLAMGLACGDIVLTVAVLAILITAPLGAFLIDLTYKRCLQERL